MYEVKDKVQFQLLRTQIMPTLHNESLWRLLTSCCWLLNHYFFLVLQLEGERFCLPTESASSFIGSNPKYQCASHIWFGLTGTLRAFAQTQNCAASLCTFSTLLKWISCTQRFTWPPPPPKSDVVQPVANEIWQLSTYNLRSYSTIQSLFSFRICHDWGAKASPPTSPSLNLYDSCSPTRATQEHPGVQPHPRQPERALGAGLRPGSAVPRDLFPPDRTQTHRVGEFCSTRCSDTNCC